jgi:hypothetical protein
VSVVAVSVLSTPLSASSTSVHPPSHDPPPTLDRVTSRRGVRAGCGVESSNPQPIPTSACRVVHLPSPSFVCRAPHSRLRVKVISPPTTTTRILVPLLSRPLQSAAIVRRRADDAAPSPPARPLRNDHIQTLLDATASFILVVDTNTPLRTRSPVQPHQTSTVSQLASLSASTSASLVPIYSVVLSRRIPSSPSIDVPSDPCVCVCAASALRSGGCIPFPAFRLSPFQTISPLEPNLPARDRVGSLAYKVSLRDRSASSFGCCP